MAKLGISTAVPKVRFPEFLKDAWERIPGDRLFDLINNRDAEAGLPILAITQEHGAIPRDLIDYHVSVTEKSIESYKVVERGDFIISLRSFQGGIEFSNYRGICSPAYVILRRKGNGSDQYFRHLFKTDRFIQQLTRNIEGLRDGKMISYKQFSDQLIPTPKLSEQQKIADCLTSLDEVISAQGRKVEALKAHKRGLMQQLFPREGETLPRLRFTEFRDAPEWDKALLGELTVIVRGGSPRPIDAFLTRQSDGLNWLKIGDVDREAKYITQTEEKVRPEALAKTRVIHAGDFILSNSMSFGRPYISTIESCIHDGWIAVTEIPEGLNREFLYYSILSHKSQRYFANQAAGSGVQNLNKDIIKLLPLEIPSKEEQQRIADCLSSLDTRIAVEFDQLATFKTHRQGLMQQLFPAPEGG